MERLAKAIIFRSLDAPRAPLRLVGAASAVRAEDIALSSDSSLQDAAGVILSSALAHFEANIPALMQSGDPESVHQMRVALRRLRAAIGLMRDVVSGEALTLARERAKTIASALGAARDLDVFRDMLDNGPREALIEEPSYYALVDAVELHRAGAYRAARTLLSSSETERFVKELRGAIETRALSTTEEMRGLGSAKVFAAQALTKLRKRALKKSRGLATLTPEARHEARIALKKARYGAEFFHSLFAHRSRARKFSRALAELQDGLGAFNDMEMANAALDRIDCEFGGRTMRAAGFVRGWFAFAAREAGAHGEESEKRLKELKPFWG